MSVRFMLGRAGTGKTARCIEEIRQKLIQEPHGHPLLLIVPDQMTFHTEYQLAATEGLLGMTRLNVYSFSRLALRVLQNTGGITRTHLSSLGLSMLYRKIIEHHANELKMFQKASKQRGFYDLLGTTLTEFKRYQILPDDLAFERERIEQNDTDNRLLSDKLHDLEWIYRQVEEALQGKYVDTEDYMKLLIRQIPKDPHLGKTEIWIDGFHQFTPQEIEVICKLAQVTPSLTITMTLDPSKIQDRKALSLFRQTEETYLRLHRTLSEAWIPMEEPVLMFDTKRFRTETLQHIEQYYETRPIPKWTGDRRKAPRLIEAVNRRAEVEHTARQILKLVRDQGYRFRDIAVVTRDLSSYEGLFRTILLDYDIPFFIDEKRSMRHHPVIEFIRSILDILHKNWRYEAVFRCIKTDLLFPTGSNVMEAREQMDRLENMVIAYGIQGERWKERKPWVYRKYRGLDQTDRPATSEDLAYQKEINQLRMQVVYPLQEFEEKMKQASTVREKCTVLYRFLEKMAIPEKIEKLRNHAETEGKLDEAREHDQVWSALIDALDQLVETGGDEPMDLSTFVSVMDTGLESLKFALVPPALDQLTIGSIDRSRLSDVKCLFILGVNDGVLPAKPQENGLLSDDDRVALGEQGMELAPDTRNQILDEEFLIYRALTSSSEKLFISYPIATEEGGTLLPSPLIGRLKQFFPDLLESFAVSEPHEVGENEQLAFVANPNRSLSFTASQIRQWAKGYPISSIWWDAYNWFIHQEEWRRISGRILKSLFDQNVELPLKKETAEALYGETIQASVSRMELFNGCPFSQFASYGLRLKERDVFKLEAPDIGQLFHTALSVISKKLQTTKTKWSDLTKDECRVMTKSTINELAPKLQREILLSTKRYHYLTHKLEQVVERALMTLSEHAKASGFSPVGLELPFGHHHPLPPLVFELNNGQKIEIIGRIDRIDKGEHPNGPLLRIIDYKSSNQDLRLSDVYYGLSLQMLTYLDVVLTHSKLWLGEQAIPAGVLYFHLHNPMLQEKRPLTEEEIESKLLKAFKMKGLILADESIVRTMDQTIETGYSDILPIALKKDGSFYKNSSVVTEEQMDTIRHHVHKVIKEVGDRLTDGDISISPYKLDKKTPCTFCSYRSICQFDPGKLENPYRQLKKLDDESVLNQLGKLGGVADDETGTSH